MPLKLAAAILLTSLSLSVLSPVQAGSNSSAPSTPEALKLEPSAPATLAMGSRELQPYIEGYAELVYRNYKESNEEATRMAAAIAAFLAEPNATTQAAAKGAWVDARQSYLQTEAFRFYEGPIDFVNADTGEEGPEGRINAWPMNEAFIDYVKGNPDSGIINNKSVNVSIESILENDQVTDEADVTTGWHAIEFLLWGQDFNNDGPGQRSYEDFIANQGNNNRRRTYLKLVTQQLVDDLTFLANEWAPNADNYRAEFVRQDPKVTMSQIFTSLATLSAFEMSSERIAVALDSGNQEDEHSCFSDTTHQDFIFNAMGIENVYRGDYGSYDGPGFDQLVAQLSPETHRQIVTALNATEAAIANLDAPFDQVLASSANSAARAEAEQAITALENQAEAFLALGPILGIDVEILAE